MSDHASLFASLREKTMRHIVYPLNRDECLTLLDYAEQSEARIAEKDRKFAEAQAELFDWREVAPADGIRSPGLLKLYIASQNVAYDELLDKLQSPDNHYERADRAEAERDEAQRKAASYLVQLSDMDLLRAAAEARVTVLEAALGDVPEAMDSCVEYMEAAERDGLEPWSVAATTVKAHCSVTAEDVRAALAKEDT